MPWGDPPPERPDSPRRYIGEPYDLYGTVIPRQHPYLNMAAGELSRRVMTGTITASRHEVHGDTATVELSVRFPDGRRVECRVSDLVSSMDAMRLLGPNGTVAWDGQAQSVYIADTLNGRMILARIRLVEYSEPLPIDDRAFTGAVNVGRGTRRRSSTRSTTTAKRAEDCGQMTGYVRGVQVDRLTVDYRAGIYNSVVVKAYLPGGDIEITGSMRRAPAPSIGDTVTWSDGAEHALIDVNMEVIACLQMKVIQIVDRYSTRSAETPETKGREDHGKVKNREIVIDYPLMCVMIGAGRALRTPDLLDKPDRGLSECHLLIVPHTATSRTGSSPALGRRHAGWPPPPVPAVTSGIKP